MKNDIFQRLDLREAFLKFSRVTIPINLCLITVIRHTSDLKEIQKTIKDVASFRFDKEIRS